MKIITPTGDSRPVVITDYQTDISVGGVLALANAKLNFQNTISANVTAVPNGAFLDVSITAIGGGGGDGTDATARAHAAFASDLANTAANTVAIYANNALVYANANVNFNNTSTVTVDVTANVANKRANISFSVPELTNAYAAANASGNLVAVYLNNTIAMANANLNFNNTSSVNVAVAANASTKRANISFTVVAASNAGVSGISALDSTITSVSNTTSATPYSANLASLTPIYVNASLIGMQRNVNIVSGNTSNLNITGVANTTNGNVTITFDTRNPPGAGGTDTAAANLVAIYANNTLAMANANVNFNNTATVNVAVTANAANKRANIAFSVNDNIRTEEIVVTFDGGGLDLTVGNANTYYTVPYSGVIDAWYLTGAPTGNVVLDVWKAAGVLPTNSNSIAGTEKPTLSSAATANDVSLSTWTTAVTRGDIFGFEVESASTTTRVTLVLRILRT